MIRRYEMHVGSVVVNGDEKQVDNVVIFTGGDPPHSTTKRRLPADALVIAADSGLEHAMRLGWPVDLVVGDLDSIRPVVLEAAVTAGVEVEAHPAAKDRTDLELALDRASGLGASRVVVVGGSGDRLDHFLANVMLLASPAYAAMEIRAYVGAGCIDVVRCAVEFEGVPGELVTLLPVHGAVEGVHTRGLLYPLAGETLVGGSTRGVSNEMTEPTAAVRVGGGVLIVVRPGMSGSHFHSRKDV